MEVHGGPRGGTAVGDLDKNESYLCWDRPIYCVEDGKVLAVVDDVPDNNGRKSNPANEPVRNSCVLVEHAGNCFSEYYHVRKGGAAVKVGQQVKAGDLLGRVGNAGASTEPHLHFGYIGLDRTGRYRNIPVRILGLTTTDGRLADGGVPRGGVEYVSAPRK
jgi:murein DD-endopeptidase MepM/ murein hydrolase activator NlpD